LFRWFSVISPFRHVVDGTRALFCFDGNAGAGLTSAWIKIAAGGAIGLLLGLTVTTLYGRVHVFSGIRTGAGRLIGGGRIAVTASESSGSIHLDPGDDAANTGGRSYRRIPLSD
jgi:hypothetical protein